MNYVRRTDGRYQIIQTERLVYEIQQDDEPLSNFRGISRDPIVLVINSCDWKTIKSMRLVNMAWKMLITAELRYLIICDPLNMFHIRDSSKFFSLFPNIVRIYGRISLTTKIQVDNIIAISSTNRLRQLHFGDVKKNYLGEHMLKLLTILTANMRNDKLSGLSLLFNEGKSVRAYHHGLVVIISTSNTPVVKGFVKHIQFWPIWRCILSNTYINTNIRSMLSGNIFDNTLTAPSIPKYLWLAMLDNKSGISEYLEDQEGLVRLITEPTREIRIATVSLLDRPDWMINSDATCSTYNVDKYKSILTGLNERRAKLRLTYDD